MIDLVRQEPAAFTIVLDRETGEITRVTCSFFFDDL